MTEHDSDIGAWARARLGTVIRGKYRLDRVLGIGGMAVVYKATHRNLAEFAVKMLHPQMSLSADVRSRFLREGYAANSVKHPGAVRVVDDDVAEDGAAFLVMELLDGVACEALWERSEGRLDEDAASAILIQLLDVLAAAHANGVVHRDIKPANLFLTRAGAVKVLDFGIARAREALSAGDQATQTGLTMGTPGFMAPEQARGSVRDIDGRTDLWAAGAAFFSLVSGELVHGGETAQELMIKAATQPARSVSDAAPHVSGTVAAIIDRALAFRKEDRWPTAQAMRDALLAERSGSAGEEEVVASLVSWSDGVAGPSDAPTLPRARAHHDGGGPPAGGTTAALSVNDRGASPGRSRAWAIAGAALAVVLAVGALGMRGRGAGAPAPRDADEAPSREAPVAVSMPTETGAIVTTGKNEDIGSGDAGTAPPVRQTEVVKQADVGAKRRSDPRPSRATAACNPNFTLDEEGRKHFKSECFLKNP